MNSLRWEFTAFALRFAAGLSAIVAVAAAAMITGLHGLGWNVVSVLVLGSVLGAVLVVFEDRARWRARKELMREEAALR